MAESRSSKGGDGWMTKGEGKTSPHITTGSFISYKTNTNKAKKGSGVPLNNNMTGKDFQG